MMFWRGMFAAALAWGALWGAGHDAEGSCYGEGGISAYEMNRHGPDGAVFLDPFLLADLEDLEGVLVMDVGCGSGPWSVYCAQRGARVYGVDIQEGMVERAQVAAAEAGVADQAYFEMGSVADLPFVDDAFDLALSINVGCNLPEPVFTMSFYEMARCLRPGGRALIAAPSSFGVVFTDGSDWEGQVYEALERINQGGMIVEELNGLTGVLRATFAMRDGVLVLITDESELAEGEDIWRKIPGLVVPNRYHSEGAYLEACEAAGLLVERVDRACGGEPGLGAEYGAHHAFAVFHILKP